MAKSAHKTKLLSKLKNNKYIGGEFSSIDLQQVTRKTRSADAYTYFPDHIGNRIKAYFESGADSIAFILSNKKESILVLWIPENYCMEAIQRIQTKLQKKTLLVRRYSKLSSIQQDKKNTNIALIVHFNGYNGPDGANLIDLSEMETIEDFTHAPLEIATSKANHSFCSLRKFIPVSASVTYTNVSVREQGNQNESAYLKIKRTASELKSIILEDSNYGSESAYLQLFKLAEEQLATASITTAHHTQTDIIEYIDFRKVLERRLSNYRFLLKTLPAFEVVRDIIPGKYMYFTLMTDYQHQLRKHCFDNGIFPAVHWHDSESPLSKKILSFHIDHRYDLKDMLRIEKVFESFKRQ